MCYITLTKAKKLTFQHFHYTATATLESYT